MGADITSGGVGADFDVQPVNTKVRVIKILVISFMREIVSIKSLKFKGNFFS